MKRFLGVWGSGYTPGTELMEESEIPERYFDESLNKILALEVGGSVQLMDSGFHVVVRLEDK